jgi:thiamine-phosphate pyrophosphorylase
MAESCLLYYITDRTAFPGDELSRRRQLLEKISEAARAGVDYIQLREKDLSTRELESLAREAVSALREGKELRPALLINSRTDIALAVGADGVHLRCDDVSPQEVRTVWRRQESSTRNPVIAVSCHSPAEVTEAAAQNATFVVFAPVFEKKDAPAAKPAGIALGGITLSNAQSCLEAGAAGIAAIRLFQENHFPEIVKRLRQKTLTVPHPNRVLGG